MKYHNLYGIRALNKRPMSFLHFFPFFFSLKPLLKHLAAYFPNGLFIHQNQPTHTQYHPIPHYLYRPRHFLVASPGSIDPQYAHVFHIWWHAASSYRLQNCPRIVEDASSNLYIQISIPHAKPPSSIYLDQ